VSQTAYACSGTPAIQNRLVTVPGGHDDRQTDVEQMYRWMRQFDSRGRRAAGQDGAPQAAP